MRPLREASIASWLRSHCNTQTVTVAVPPGHSWSASPAVVAIAAAAEAAVSPTESPAESPTLTATVPADPGAGMDACVRAVQTVVFALLFEERVCVPSLVVHQCTGVNEVL